MAVCELLVDHVELDVMSRFVPSGKVAVADIWTELVRPTPHGEGDTAIAETLDDDVELPQAKQAREDETNASDESEMSFMVRSLCKFAARASVSLFAVATPLAALAAIEGRWNRWRPGGGNRRGGRTRGLRATASLSPRCEALLRACSPKGPLTPVSCPGMTRRGLRLELACSPSGARSAVTGAHDEITDASMARDGHRHREQSGMMTIGIAAIVLAGAYIALWLRQAMPDNSWRRPSGRK